MSDALADEDPADRISDLHEAIEWCETIRPGDKGYGEARATLRALRAALADVTRPTARGAR